MHLSMVSPIPHLGNTLGIDRGFVLILVPHGWGIVLQVTPFMQLAIAWTQIKGTVILL